MTLKSSLLIPPILWIVASGCDQEQRASGVTVEDSAGVELISNEIKLDELPPRLLTGDPEREIAEEALFEVTGIQPLSGNRLAVGVNGAGAVFIYDGSGERTMTLGAKGEGPGEFRSVGSLVPLPGDSLGVYDPLLKRLTAFPLNSDPPRTVDLSHVAPGRGWSRVLPLEGDLAIVGEGGLGDPGHQGVYRLEETSYRMDRDGKVLATYGQFPGLEAFTGENMMGRAPFGARLAAGTLGDRLIVGPAKEAQLQVYGPQGTLQRLIRWIDTDRTVTEEDINRFLEFMLDQVPAEQRSAMRPSLEAMSFAPRSPSHSEILVSPNGWIWVGEYAGPEAELPVERNSITRRWVLFGTDGVLRERIQTPRGFMPMALADDVVWGVYQNELDVESVRAYRVDTQG